MCNQGASGLSLRDPWIGQRQNEAAPPDTVSPGACFLSFWCRHPRMELHWLRTPFAQVDVVWILSIIEFHVDTIHSILQVSGCTCL